MDNSCHPQGLVGRVAPKGPRSQRCKLLADYIKGSWILGTAFLTLMPVRRLEGGPHAIVGEGVDRNICNHESHNRFRSNRLPQQLLG
jgi:hypothetical protein